MKATIREGDSAMPAYEYQCQQCQIRFEKRQKMSEEPLRECPECGGEAKRLISGGAAAISKHNECNGPCASGGPCCGSGACGM
jgi:putative FmdB family regulatory protein